MNLAFAVKKNLFFLRGLSNPTNLTLKFFWLAFFITLDFFNNPEAGDDEVFHNMLKIFGNHKGSG